MGRGPACGSDASYCKRGSRRQSSRRACTRTNLCRPSTRRTRGCPNPAEPAGWRGCKLRAPPGRRQARPGWLRMARTAQCRQAAPARSSCPADAGRAGCASLTPSGPRLHRPNTACNTPLPPATLSMAATPLSGATQQRRPCAASSRCCAGASRTRRGARNTPRRPRGRNKGSTRGQAALDRRGPRPRRCAGHAGWTAPNPNRRFSRRQCRPLKPCRSRRQREAVATTARTSPAGTFVRPATGPPVVEACAASPHE
mmetsp:Transcript_22030/g.63200  ORF Transcript_22030/g.63200 Transcript_22030/m.63200 type:complete len:256 (+) Transcript_22030:726-1493(+)